MTCAPCTFRQFRDLRGQLLDGGMAPRSARLTVHPADRPVEQLERPYWLAPVILEALRRARCLVRVTYSQSTCSAYLQAWSPRTGRRVCLRWSDHGGGSADVRLTDRRGRRRTAHAVRELCALLDLPAPLQTRGGRYVWPNETPNPQND